MANTLKIMLLKIQVGDFVFFRIKNKPRNRAPTIKIQISLSIGTGSPTGGGIDRGRGGKG